MEGREGGVIGFILWGLLLPQLRDTELPQFCATNPGGGGQGGWDVLVAQIRQHNSLTEDMLKADTGLSLKPPPTLF